MSFVVLTPDELEVLLMRTISAYVAAAPIAEKEPVEILTQDELAERLKVSVQSIIRYRQKQIIPCMEIGSCVRYDFHQVVKALSKTKSKK